VRIGVATGLAIVGREQAVVGEPRDVATGLRNLASPNSVLVAESTRKLLSGALVCENPGRHQFVGISEAVNACRVVGRRAVDSRFNARPRRKIARLVDRDQELRQLSPLWAPAKRG
jgi:class 3 adenylate cyclase